MGGVIICLVLVIIFILFVWSGFNTGDGGTKTEESSKVDLLNNKKFINLLKKIIDDPNMKLPLEQSTIETICEELKQDGIEITTDKLQKDINDGLIQYVVQEYVRVQLGDEVWPEQYVITDVGLDGLYTLFEQKGATISKLSLREKVNSEFLRQGKERFKESFFRFKPELREQNVLTDTLVKAYVDVFEESYHRQLKNFVWLLNEVCPRIYPYSQVPNEYTVPEVEKMIQDEIKRRADLRMAEAIKSTIQTGHVNRRRIQIEDIDVMDGLEFEQFLEKLFTTMGYKVERTKASGDQGADLIAEKFGSRIAIQAKCYNGSVGNKAVQEVIGAMQYYRCERGMVVTNSTFTKSAIELAQSSNVELIDRARLIELINKYGYEVEASSLTYKDQAVNYLDLMRDHSSRFGNYWNMLTNLFSDPRLSDDEWKSQCKALFADIKTHTENVPKIIPPKMFEHAHELYLKSMEQYNIVAQKMPDFIDAENVDGMNSLLDNMSKGTQYLNQAEEEVKQVINELQHKTTL